MPQQPNTQQTGMNTQMSGQSRQMGGQMSGQNTQAMGQMGGGAMQQTQSRLPMGMRESITSIAQAIEVCEWCADQCVQEANPAMIECIRLCEDVSELGEAALALTSRQSRYGQSVAQSFLQAVQACAQECGRHQADHCQECAQTLNQVSQSCQQLLQSAQQTTQ